MRSHPCPICRGRTVVIWSQPDFRLYQFPVRMLRPVHAFAMTLHLRFCAACCHAHVWPTPGAARLQEFYVEEYEGYTSPLDTQGLTASLNEPAVTFLIEEMQRRFGGGAHVADVGGYDGYLLTRLGPAARETLLIEGSHSGAAIARRHGIPVLEAFLDGPLSRALAGRFDVVVCRHVIEHISKPGPFVVQLTRLMAPDGLLVLETPDLPAILQRLLVRAVSLQHVHLFSPRSMRRVLAAAGLRPVRIDYPARSAFILAAERAVCVGTPLSGRAIDQPARSRRNALTFAQRLDRRHRRLRRLIEKWKAESRRVWIWGAGTAGGELFHVYRQDPDHFEGYIDSDAGKTAMRFPSVPGLPICTPGRAAARGVGAVLIASASVDEVRTAIARLGWNVPVADLYSLREHRPTWGSGVGHGNGKAGR